MRWGLDVLEGHILSFSSSWEYLCMRIDPLFKSVWMWYVYSWTCVVCAYLSMHIEVRGQSHVYLTQWSICQCICQASQPKNLWGFSFSSSHEIWIQCSMLAEQALTHCSISPALIIASLKLYSNPICDTYLYTSSLSIKYGNRVNLMWSMG